MLAILFGGTVFAKAPRTESVKVQIHKETKLVRSKLSIKFVELVDDSRCPTGVQCIWAGNGKIKVSIKRTSGAAKIFEMDTNGPNNSVLYAGYKITLTGLTPHPAENIRINRNGYVAAFTVQK
jgi:hypothetical protein